MLRNVWRRQYRDTRVRHHHETAAAGRGDGAGRPADDTYGHLLLQRRVVDAVLALDEPLRSAVTLRYLDGHSYDEVAQRQGIGLAAARKRVSRGLAALRSSLDREYGGERASWCAIALSVAAEHSSLAPAPAGAAPAAASPALVLGGVSMSVKLVTGLVAAVAVGLSLWLFAVDRGADTALPNGAAADPRAPAQLADQAERAHARPFSADARTAVAAEAVAADAEPALDRDRDLHGVVLDPAGDPVAGASVCAVREELTDFSVLDIAHHHDQTELGATETDREGRFAITLEAGRRVHLVARARGFAPARVFDCYAGQCVEIRVWRGGSLHGWVTRASDGAAARARLRMWYHASGGADPHYAETDAAGHYRFDDLAPGALRLEVHSREGASPSWIELNVRAGEELRHDVVLPGRLPVHRPRDRRDDGCADRERRGRRGLDDAQERPHRRERRIRLCTLPRRGLVQTLGARRRVRTTQGRGARLPTRRAARHRV